MAGCSHLSTVALPYSNRVLRTGLGVVFWLLATATQAQVYKWTDAAGQVHYGDRPSAQFPTEQIETAAPPVDSAATGLRPGEQKLLQETTTKERRLTRERQAQAREEARYRQAEAARRRSRCEDYRRRLRRLEAKLVAGYRAGESNRLHDQRDEYQMKLKEYCD